MYQPRTGVMIARDILTDQKYVDTCKKTRADIINTFVDVDDFIVALKQVRGIMNQWGHDTLNKIRAADCALETNYSAFDFQSPIAKFKGEPLEPYDCWFRSKRAANIIGNAMINIHIPKAERGYPTMATEGFVEAYKQVMVIAHDIDVSVENFEKERN